MAKKLIYAEDLLKAVRDDPGINGLCFKKLKQHIEEAQDAVKRGWWIHHNKGQNNWVECSECNTVGSPFWKCCPVCEARVNGEEDG